MKFKESITREEIAELPIAVYEGRVVIVDDEQDVKAAVEPLLNASVLGFDTETRPAFKKGEKYPVSLLQLATPDYVVLFRLNKIKLPALVVSIFENPNIIKVGVGIRDDIKALNGSRPIQPKGFVDLQVVASDYGIKDKSFSKLMAILFGVHTSKRQRVTNWAADELTEAQIRYAATDAWGACIMYNKLKSCEAPISIKSEV